MEKSRQANFLKPMGHNQLPMELVIANQCLTLLNAATVSWAFSNKKIKVGSKWLVTG